MGSTPRNAIKLGTWNSSLKLLGTMTRSSMGAQLLFEPSNNLLCHGSLAFEIVPYNSAVEDGMEYCCRKCFASPAVVELCTKISFISQLGWGATINRSFVLKPGRGSVLTPLIHVLSGTPSGTFFSDLKFLGSKTPRSLLVDGSFAAASEGRTGSLMDINVAPSRGIPQTATSAPEKDAAELLWPQRAIQAASNLLH